MRRARKPRASQPLTKNLQEVPLMEIFFSKLCDLALRHTPSGPQRAKKYKLRLRDALFTISAAPCRTELAGNLRYGERVRGEGQPFVIVRSTHQLSTINFSSTQRPCSRIKSTRRSTASSSG